MSICPEGAGSTAGEVPEEPRIAFPSDRVYAHLYPVSGSSQVSAKTGKVMQRAQKASKSCFISLLRFRKAGLFTRQPDRETKRRASTRVVSSGGLRQPCQKTVRGKHARGVTQTRLRNTVRFGSEGRSFLKTKGMRKRIILRLRVTASPALLQRVRRNSNYMPEVYPLRSGKSSSLICGSLACIVYHSFAHPWRKTKGSCRKPVSMVDDTHASPPPGGGARPRRVQKSQLLLLH